MELKIGEARVLYGGNCCGHIIAPLRLGKRVYLWDVPLQLSRLSKKNGHAFIGRGRWKNSKGSSEKSEYICVAASGNLWYIDRGALCALGEVFA